MDWTEAYRPESLAAVRGNDTACGELEEWADTWSEHRRAVILHGSPGVGKTSAAHALAAERGWSVIELNASDVRTADVVERVAGEAAKTGTLTEGGAGRRLVILDEADNFHGTADYGGAAAVTSLVSEANQPVVLIANEYYEMSQTLRRNCEDVEFRDLSTRSIVPALRDICRREDVEFDAAALEAIAEASEGDLRSAINDLQAVAETAERLTAEDVVTGERDREQDIFAFLDGVIKEADAEAAIELAYDVDEEPGDLLRWLEDNLPKDFTSGELADAYAHLVAADRWLGRTWATQEYRYWRYATTSMTAGVASSRRGAKGGWTRYGPPAYWSKLGRTRSTRDTRDDIARRIAAGEGTSLADARREVLPYLARMTHHCRPRDLTVDVAAAFDLDAEEVSFVTGSGADTNKVADVVADARARRSEGAVAHFGVASAPDPDALATAADEAGSEGADGSGVANGTPRASADDGTAGRQGQLASTSGPSGTDATAGDRQSALGDTGSEAGATVEDASGDSGEPRERSGGVEIASADVDPDRDDGGSEDPGDSHEGSGKPEADPERLEEDAERREKDSEGQEEKESAQSDNDQAGLGDFA